MKRLISLLCTCSILLSCAIIPIHASAYSAAKPLPALTGDQAYDAAEIAKSQYGYTYNNGTVYGHWWQWERGFKLDGGDYTYEGWCAMFACWCAWQAGSRDGFLYNPNSPAAYSPYYYDLWDWFVDHGRGYTPASSQTPREGDFVFFEGHVGVVYRYSSGVITFYAGNEGKTSNVAKGTVEWKPGAVRGGQALIGIGRPNYKTTAPPVTTISVTTDSAANVTETTASLSGSYHNPGSKTVTRHGFKYGISSSNLNLDASVARNESYVSGGIPAYTIKSLQPGTTYYYKAFVEADGKTYYGDVKSFTTKAVIQSHVTFRSMAGDLPSADRVCKIDGFNRDRGGNELIVFDAWGTTVTTNTYGHEVSVDSSGKVTKYRDYGNATQLVVPQNGFVVSAQGTSSTSEAARFVIATDVGDYIGYDSSSYSVCLYKSEEAYLAHHKVVKTGSTYGKLPTPTKAGYVFDGWYTKSSGGTKVTADTAVTATADHTLYAHWVEKPAFSVSFDANGGTLPSADATCKISGFNRDRGSGELIVFDVPGTTVTTNTYGHELSVNMDGVVTHYRDYGNTSQLIVPQGGFIVSGQGTSTTSDAARFVIAADLYDYIGYDSKAYAVCLYKSEDAYLCHHKTVKETKHYGPLPTITREGYTFDGWYTSVTGGTKVTADTVVTADSAHTLYAHWTKNNTPANASVGTDKTVYSKGETVIISPEAENAEEYTVNVYHEGKLMLTYTYEHSEKNSFSLVPKEIGDYTVVVQFSNGAGSAEASCAFQVEPLFTLEDPDDLGFDFTIVMGGAASWGTKATMFVAAYEDSGRMIGCYSEEVTFTKAETDMAIDKPFGEAEYRVFFLDEDMVPLCEELIIEP